MTPEAILAARTGLVVAPAGCGKTYLLTEAVKKNTAGRILILTHTRAGVAVIRSRLSAVAQAQYRVTTLDAWCGWLATRFPALSQFVPSGTPADYDLAKQGALRILQIAAFGELMAATYSHILVDEYQDCGRLQHAVMKAVAKWVPVIAFGDPMQAIFGFNQPLPPWHQVAQSFEITWTLDIPHRWINAGEDAFGRWVLARRADLEQGRSIDLRQGPPNVRWVRVPVGVTLRDHYLTAIPDPSDASTLLVINDSMQRQERRDLARWGNRLAVVENAELADLRTAAARIEMREGIHRITAVLDFADSVMTGVDTASLSDRLGRMINGTAAPPFTKEEEALLACLSLDGLAGCLAALRKGRTLFRPDLYESLCQAARTRTSSLKEAAARVQARRLDLGRRIEARAVGSTLLLKGLEADHAVVLDADKMSAPDLYVAISRASRTLTVVSRSPVLPCP